MTINTNMTRYEFKTDGVQSSLQYLIVMNLLRCGKANVAMW